jgi:hypothetical protein
MPNVVRLHFAGIVDGVTLVTRFAPPSTFERVRGIDEATVDKIRALLEEIDLRDEGAERPWRDRHGDEELCRGCCGVGGRLSLGLDA